MYSIFPRGNIFFSFGCIFAWREVVKYPKCSLSNIHWLHTVVFFKSLFVGAACKVLTPGQEDRWRQAKRSKNFGYLRVAFSTLLCKIFYSNCLVFTWLLGQVSGLCKPLPNNSFGKPIQIQISINSAGDRVHEFSMKLAGASYMEVHKAGGGINFTVEHTRSAGH